MAVAAILACEFFLRLPFNTLLIRLVRFSKRAVSVLRSRKISDHWKEKALPCYAVKIGMASLALGALLCAALSPFVVVTLLFSPRFSELIHFFADLSASLGITVLAVGYLVLRRKLLP